MSDDDAPAYSRASQAMRLPGRVSLEDLSADWAWGGSTGEGARVAVVDSGIDADHPALGGCVDVDDCVALHLDEDGTTVVEERGPHGDLFGHGTACAGIIHALAPRARITSVRVLGTDLTGRAAVFLRGLAWAIEQKFDVINLSLGTSKRDWALPFYELCDEAYFQSSFVVTAANNVLRPSFPSMFGAVASVACNLSNDPLRFHYNPDPPTEFLARGIDVEVPWLDHGWISSTGNSYAAPHIAGFATLIRAKHPQLRPFQVKTALWATAANVREAPEIAGRLSRVLRAPTRSARATAALRRSRT
jgi:subtilisin family serine protease